MLGILLVLVTGGGWAYSHFRNRESTDDSQVEAHITLVAPRVPGNVLTVLVKDNQEVKAGDILVRLDPRDYEVKVAQAKIDPARLARIAADMGVKAGEPFTVTEFLKPGIEEMCSLLPPKLARRILALSERRGWTDRVHWGMEVNSASVSGFLRFWMLAKLRGWRPKSYRFQEEQRAIEAWLGLIVEAARLSDDLALEVAECARLVKGYGDTHKRGTGNYRLIEARVIRPALAGRIPLRQGVDATASARAAALLDPDGETLARCLAELEDHHSPRIAAE